MHTNKIKPALQPIFMLVRNQPITIRLQQHAGIIPIADKMFGEERYRIKSLFIYVVIVDIKQQVVVGDVAVWEVML